VTVIVKFAEFVPGAPGVAWMLIVGRGTGITDTPVDTLLEFPVASVMIALTVKFPERL